MPVAVDAAAIGGRSARRRGRPVPADDERPGQPLGVRAAGRGIRRHHAGSPTFRSQLGAPPGSIADRLQIFTANGVLRRRRRRIDYRLTEKGRALFRSWSPPCSGRSGGFARPKGPR